MTNSRDTLAFGAHQHGRGRALDGEEAQGLVAAQRARQAGVIVQGISRSDAAGLA